MKKNKIALQIVSFGLIVLTFIACDKDFASIESDVINNDIATNFDILSERYDVITYTQAFDPLENPIQTNELGLSTLGIYDDVYGRTTSSFVSQITASSYNPDFGDETVIDSVVLTIPYFSEATGFDDSGNTTYDVDSILPDLETYNNINLRIFENNYFLRDFNPSAGFNEGQVYYSNKTAEGSGDFSNALLGEELVFVEYSNGDNPVMSVVDNNNIVVNNKGYALKDVNNLNEEGDKTLLETQAPGIRVMLHPDFWKNKIIDKEGDVELSNQNNFLDYFRGLYFLAEPVDGKGSYLILNTTNANIKIYYKKLTTSTTDDPGDTETGTYILNFGSNKINFFDNDFTLPVDTGDEQTGDNRIYLKGGEGSVAGIKLFNGEDLDGAPLTNAFETFKNAYVETDDNGNYVRSKRLINEANLVFYVDQNQINALGGDPKNEPNRIYVYNQDHRLPVVDYFLAGSNENTPEFSKLSHLGMLERVDEDDSQSAGIKYKLKITEHINNLILRDSTNVELGLAVSLNVNLEGTSGSALQKKVKGTDDYAVPISSILTPRGTILHGSNSDDETKRVSLEIYYTCPEGVDCCPNGENCD
ncbi:DUF4270 domain-containing protein [Winogradskyella bathintestinalis]|uniref:DUF4270 domain-containing protein n=1 Tax=Winogradskyella bathintestinalis TaxID=3035208 RepID=A0ABT7ZSL1_9FLAO|nr:DUF4270 domain-containing protein [Winogradskyella bathintestinalis]MDN3491799.1 DUF4270 domain-containing protein [Winogradskyella bathintestinalis]